MDRINTERLQVDSSGIIVSNGALTVGGDASFISRAANAGTVRLASAGDTTFGNSMIGGSLIADINGQPSQTGVLQVAGDIVVNNVLNEVPTGPLVNTVGDPRQDTVLNDGSVIITDVGTVSLEAANYPADLIVTSLARGILGFDEVLDDIAIALENPNNTFGETVQFETQIGQAEVITGIPGISQTGPISVAGTANLNATDLGNIGLTTADNQLPTISFLGRDVGLVSNSGIILLTSAASGDLSIEAGGLLCQSPDETLRVAGATDLTTTHTGAGDVALNTLAGLTRIGQSLIGGNPRPSPSRIIRPGQFHPATFRTL